MKKFNKLVCVGILGLVGLFGCIVANAADSNIKIREYNTDGLNTQSLDVVFFNNYTENAAGEIFSGSTTTSGGTSTFSNGVVDVAGWTGNSYFGLYLSPTTAGSVTIRCYGVFGTSTAPSGTSNASLIDMIIAGDRTKSYTFSGTTATSTTFYIDYLPTLIAMSVDVTSGTMSVTAGMHKNKTK